MWSKIYSDKRHKLFIIDFSGDRRVLFPIVAKTVERFMKPGESFELIKAYSDLTKEAGKITKPLYIRKSV